MKIRKGEVIPALRANAVLLVVSLLMLSWTASLLKLLIWNEGFFLRLLRLIGIPVVPIGMLLGPL